MRAASAVKRGEFFFWYQTEKEPHIQSAEFLTSHGNGHIFKREIRKNILKSHPQRSKRAD
jgi:hypothetical protein